MAALRRSGPAAAAGRWARWDNVARFLVRQFETVLDCAVEVDLLDGQQERDMRRRLAAKAEPLDCDVLLLDHGAQAADAVVLELHRAFVGRTGEFRAGPVLPKFETLYGRMDAQRGPMRQMLAGNLVDRYVTQQALALFLAAPQALYAVNRQVNFRPYRTTFELADTSVTEEHWSRRRG